MQNVDPYSLAKPCFGLRKVAPCACVADKRHIQDFFCDSLEELGFVTCRWEDGGPADLLATRQPDLVVLGLSNGGIFAAELLEVLSAHSYTGKVLVFGQAASPMVAAVQKYGGELGLDMLPLLPTPFSDETLHQRVAELLPPEVPPSPAVDVAEALHANWLELWYQPKVEIRSFTLCGAEALVRMRHPSWGIVQPAYFIPDERDPNFAALSEFVVSQAMRDWHRFVADYGHVELAVNLPMSYFERAASVDELAAHMPKHPAFAGAVVEVNGADIVQHLDVAVRAADRLRLHNIALAIDDLGEEWPLLLELDECPFAEIKVDRSFVAGCADDRLKQSVCRRILDAADRLGVRTVAEGVENRADFTTVRELGFDVVQGYFLAKPMDAHKFARRILRQPLTMQGLC
jgi:EAL domain-containing protein (putative c-di-GMP-specific phosphodiesterase class I)/CheY-like chemotaxis protein